MKTKTKIRIKIALYNALKNIFDILFFPSGLFVLLQAIPALIQCLAILFRCIGILSRYTSLSSFIYDILFFHELILIELPFSISPLVSIIFFGWFNRFCLDKSLLYFDVIKTLEHTLSKLCPKCGSESEIVSEHNQDSEWTRTEEKITSIIYNPDGKEVAVMKTPYEVKYTVSSTECNFKCKSCGHTWTVWE